MKTKYKKIVYFSILIVLVFIIFGIIDFLKYTLFDPHLYKIYPDISISGYAVVFDQGAMQCSSRHFGIIDKKGKESNLIILGTLDYVDIPLRFVRFVLSFDGTVIASESYCGLDKGTTSYWLAYDFVDSISYGGQWKPREEDPNLIKERNDAIQALLFSRGGIGKEFIEVGFKEENKLSYLEWKRWQKQINKAKDNCKPWTPDDIVQRRE